MFLPLLESALIFLTVFEIKLAQSLLDIMFPVSFINVPVLVPVLTLVSLIVPKSAIKNISVEQSQLTLGLLIILPLSTKYRALSKEVIALTMLFTLAELSNILIFIGILEISNPIRQLLMKLTRVYTPIRIHHTALPLLDSVHELSHVHKFALLVLVIPASGLDPVDPLSLVKLFGSVQNPSPVFQIVHPCP